MTDKQRGSMKEIRVCQKCKQEYEAKAVDVLGVHIILGRDYCPHCSQEILDKLEIQEAATLQAGILGERRRHREQCGIPPKFMNQDFSTFEKGWQDEAFNKCWEYACEFPVEARPVDYPSLYIYSERSWGVGKTHLSCAIAHRIFDRWNGGERGCPRVVFVSEPDLLRKIRATYNYSAEEKQYRESEDDIIRNITYADLLILDDVGKEQVQDPSFVQRTLFAIIDGRYKASLPIVLTANLNPTQLKRHIGSAPLDRSYEMTKGQAVLMDGNSYRRK